MKGMMALPCALLIAMATGLATSACSDDDRSYVSNVVDGETTPTMLTYDVNTFISDSGYTRYYITAPLWAMHEDAQEPFWRFPEGLYLEQYDRDLNINSTLRCDSARYLSQRRVWRLDGNVVMVNTASDSFLTQQVFWDQSNRTVYSDSFIHIVRSDRIIEGYGFNSNEQMTSYTVNKPTGIFPVNRAEKETSSASEESDSVPVSDSRRKPRSTVRNSAAESIPAAQPEPAPAPTQAPKPAEGQQEKEKPTPMQVQPKTR